MVTFLKKLKKNTARLLRESKDAVINEVRKDNARRNKLRFDKKEKFKLVKGLTNAEILKVTKNFISVSPKFVFTNAQGKLKSRKPTRDEMVDAILMRVNISSIRKILNMDTVVKRKSPVKRVVKKKSVKRVVKRKKKSSNDIFTLTI